MRMLFFYFIFLFKQVLICQEIGDIVIGIGRINSTVSSDQKDFAGLRVFISSGLSKSAMSYSENEDANFFLQSDISFSYEKNIDINGVPMKVAELHFNFKLASKYGNLQFGNYSAFIKESGESKSVLLSNAIQLLRKKSPEFEAFLRDSRIKIMEYYRIHCEEILAAGEQYLRLEQFDECIFNMGQVPKEVECSRMAQQLMVKAYQAKLEKNCEIVIGKIRGLIQKEAFSEAYDLISILPQNTKCKDKTEMLVDELDHSVCERYILSAEAHFAKGNFSNCVDILSSIEKISKNCQARKESLERKITARLDASAKKQWEFKMMKYKDQLAKDQEQARTNHEFAMKKLDVDATVRSKELDVSVEMEKYKTQREIEFSKNNAAVEKVRYKEMSKIYRSYFNMVGNVLIQTSR